MIPGPPGVLERVDGLEDLGIPHDVFLQRPTPNTKKHAIPLAREIGL